jgi:hypothetical protein
MSYIVVKQVQRGLYQAYFRGTENPVCENGTPLRCFTKRQEARDYISKNWSNIQ